MARRRASMREGPLAELFRATEAAQRQAEQGAHPEGQSPEGAPAEGAAAPPAEPEERTVEHVPSWEESVAATPPPVRWAAGLGDESSPAIRRRCRSPQSTAADRRKRRQFLPDDGWRAHRR